MSYVCLSLDQHGILFILLMILEGYDARTFMVDDTQSCFYFFREHEISHQDSELVATSFLSVNFRAGDHQHWYQDKIRDNLVVVGEEAVDIELPSLRLLVCLVSH